MLYSLRHWPWKWFHSWKWPKVTQGHLQWKCLIRRINCVRSITVCVLFSRYCHKFVEISDFFIPTFCRVFGVKNIFWCSGKWCRTFDDVCLAVSRQTVEHIDRSAIALKCTTASRGGLKYMLKNIINCHTA